MKTYHVVQDSGGVCISGLPCYLQNTSVPVGISFDVASYDVAGQCKEVVCILREKEKGDVLLTFHSEKQATTFINHLKGEGK